MDEDEEFECLSGVFAPAADVHGNCLCCGNSLVGQDLGFLRLTPGQTAVVELSNGRRVGPDVVTRDDASGVKFTLYGFVPADRITKRILA